MKISQIETLAPVLTKTIQYIQSILNFPVNIWLLVDEEHEFRIVASSGLAEDYVQKAVIRKHEISMVTHAFNHTKTVIVPDIQQETRWKSKIEFAEMKLNSAVASVIKVKSKIIGVLGVYLPETPIVDLETLAVKLEHFAELFSDRIRERIAAENLNRVTRLLNTQIQSDELLVKIMESAKTVLDCEHVSVFTPNETGCLELKASSTPDIKRKKFKCDEGLLGHVYQTGTSLIVNDVRNHLKFIQGETNPDIEERSMILCPIKSEDQIIGVISSDYHGLDGFDEFDQVHLESLAEHVVIALINAKLFLDAHQQRKSLVEIGKEITSRIKLKEDEIYELIYQQANEKLGIKNLSIAIYDEQSDTVAFKLAAVLGERVDFTKQTGWEPRKSGQGKTERIINSKKELWLKTQKEVEATEFSAIPNDKNWTGRIPNSWIGVPMIASGKVLGVIANYGYGRDYLFSETDVEILQALADLGAIAIENARLYNFPSELIANLTDIVSSPKPDVVIHNILESTLNLIKKKGFAEIRLLNKAKNELEPKYRTGENINKLLGSVPITKGITGRVVREKTPLMVLDVSKDQHYLCFVEETKSEIAVPLFQKNGEIFGVLNIESPHLNAFSDDEFEKIKSYANLFSIIIENLLLFEQSNKRNKQLEAIYKISEANLKTTHLQELCQEIRKILGELMNAKNFRIVLFEQNGKIRKPPLYYIDEYDRTVEEQEEVIEKGLTGYVFKTEKALICDPKIRAELINKKEIENIGKQSKSWLGVPLISQNKKIGVMTVMDYDNEGSYTDAEAGLFEFVSEQVAMAIERIKTLEDLEEMVKQRTAELHKTNDELENHRKNLEEIVQKRTASLNALFQISEISHTVNDLNDLYPRIHDIIKSLMSAKNFYISLYDENTKLRTFPYFYEDNQLKTINPLPLDKGVSGYVIFTGQPLLGQPEKLDELERAGKLVRIGRRSLSWIGAPLITNKKTIGVAAVQSYDSYTIYNEDDLNLLIYISKQIAISIERLQARKEQQITLEKLKTLNQRKEKLIKLVQTVTSAIQLTDDELFKLIRKNASELMDANNMYIGLYDSENDFVKFPLAYKDGKPTKIPERKAGSGRTEEIIRSGEPILTYTRKEAEEWYKQPGRAEYMNDPLASWIGVPMKSGNKVLGVVAAYHPFKDNVYDKDDLEILQAMAEVVAIAMDNARAYQQLKEAQNEIANRERELVVSGIAMDFIHKMNNLAGTIPPWTDLIEAKLDQNIVHPKVFDYLNKIRRDTSNILKEAHTLKDFRFTNETIDMEDIVGSIIGQLEMGTPASIIFKLSVPESLLKVFGVKDHVSTAIHSVIYNGVKSVSGAGKIQVSLQNIHQGSNDYVEVLIIDTGCGIPQEIIDNLFEYGNSFWHDKRGTGYGLWRAKNIIQSMKGTIEIPQTEVNKGSTFRILLPAVQDKISINS